MIDTHQDQVDFEQIYFNNRIRSIEKIDFNNLNTVEASSHPAMPFEEYCVHNRTKNIMFR